MIGVVVIALVGGYFFFKSRNTPAVVPTETVKRGSIVETVSVTGELVPTQYADLSFSGIGTVDAVLVAKGDVVKQNQPIASLDRTVLQSQLSEARVALSIADKNKQLALRSRSTLKKEEIAVKKLQVSQAEQDVKTIIAQMNEDVLVSPVDGMISKFDARVGETMAAGQMVARVVKDASVLIEARVPESDIAKVKVGMKAKVTFDALSTDDIFESEVTEIDPAATVVQDVVSYVVKFRLSSSDDRLREGMTANVDIVTAQADNILTVPFRALTKEAGKTYAQVRRADGTLERVVVSVGLEGEEGVVEIKSGLKEGDTVTIGAVQAN